jgi:hypothetical protein
MTEIAAGAGIDTSGHTGTFIMCAHAASDTLYRSELAESRPPVCACA